jgi:hypothetical protein
VRPFMTLSTIGDFRLLLEAHEGRAEVAAS